MQRRCKCFNRLPKPASESPRMDEEGMQIHELISVLTIQRQFTIRSHQRELDPSHCCCCWPEEEQVRPSRRKTVRVEQQERHPNHQKLEPAQAEQREGDPIPMADSAEDLEQERLGNLERHPNLVEQADLEERLLVVVPSCYPHWMGQI
jgi:hypothetical protein